jgi:DNA-binding IscR family transcriptional regulator
MTRDSKLSSVLHLLLHMADAGGPSTSETLAVSMKTNPVVVRRLLAGLREAGVVRSEKGHGGGWKLDRDLSAVTLADVHRALGSPALVSFGNRTDQPRCLVEQAVNAALDGACEEAESLLLARFARITLATLQTDFRRRMRAHGCSNKEHPSHDP